MIAEDALSIDYLEKFPDGSHKEEIDEMIKQLLIEKGEQTFYDFAMKQQDVNILYEYLYNYGDGTYRMEVIRKIEHLQQSLGKSFTGLKGEVTEAEIMHLTIGDIKLKDGNYYAQHFGRGMNIQEIAFCDFDGDGDQDAIVVEWAHRFTSLVAIENINGIPEKRSESSLGFRITLEDYKLVDCVAYVTYLTDALSENRDRINQRWKYVKHKDEFEKTYENIR